MNPLKCELVFILWLSELDLLRLSLLFVWSIFVKLCPFLLHSIIYLDDYILIILLNSLCVCMHFFDLILCYEIILMTAHGSNRWTII